MDFYIDTKTKAQTQNKTTSINTKKRNLIINRPIQNRPKTL